MNPNGGKLGESASYSAQCNGFVRKHARGGGRDSKIDHCSRTGDTSEWPSEQQLAGVAGFVRTSTRPLLQDPSVLAVAQSARRGATFPGRRSDRCGMGCSCRRSKHWSGVIPGPRERRL